MSTDASIYKDPDYRRPHKKATNPLLVRPVVGRVKPSTYKLPPQDFTYGRKDQFDEEGVREVVGTWKEHKAAPEDAPGRDFVRLNRKAAVTGVTDPKTTAEFRKHNDIRLNKGTLKIDSSVQRDPYAGKTFGKPSGVPEPISGVLSNAYQREHLQNHREKEAGLRKKQAAAREVRRKASGLQTRASIGHQRAPQAERKEPFKMARFKDVPSRVKNMPGNQTQTVERPMPEVFVPHGGPPPSSGGVMLVEPPRTQESEQERLNGSP